MIQQDSTTRPKGRTGGRARLLIGGVAVVFALVAGVACGGNDGIRISAITATPNANVTATAEPLETGTPTGPVREVVPLPPLPDNPFASGRTVGTYIQYIASEGANLGDCMPELTSSWAMSTDIEGPRCMLVDLDGDRRDEYLLLVSFGSGETRQTDVWFYQDAEENFRFFNSARALANAFTPGLVIHEVTDLTGDDLPEVVMTWQDCTTTSCTTQLLIASAHHGQLENVTPQGASISALDSFEIDGRTIVMTGGGSGDSTTGPQRSVTRTVSWAGTRFRTDSEPGEATHLVHLLNDADVAYSAGNYNEARALYLAAAGNNSLRDWMQETTGTPGRPELQTYAFFRAALSAQRAGDSTASLTSLVDAIIRHRDTVHAAAAEAYLGVIQEGGSPGQACQAAEEALSGFEAQYAALWNYGTANPQRTVFTLCR